MVIELFFALRLSIRVGGSPPTPAPLATPGGGAFRFRTVMLLVETGPALKPPPPAVALTVAIESGEGCVEDEEAFRAVEVRVEKGRFKLGATLTSCDLTTMLGPGRTFRTAVPAPPLPPPIVFVITRSCLRPLRNDIVALLEPPAVPAVTVLGGGLLIAIRWPVLVIFVILTLSDSGDILVVAVFVVGCNRPRGLTLARAFGSDCCWLEMDTVVPVDGKMPTGTDPFTDDCCCWRWASSCFFALAIARLLLVRVAPLLELFIRC